MKRKFNKGLSRGDGDNGEDILRKFKNHSSIPKKINAKDVPNY